jgi:hypothetical protein
MELGPSLIGLAIVVAMVAPIVYMHKIQKGKETKFIKSFFDIARNKNLNINEHEIWNGAYVIGIDKQSQKVFYMKKAGEEQGKAIDLAEISRCRIAERSRKIKSSSENSKIIDRLDLVFIHKDPQKPDKMLEFFNGEESLSLRGELPIIERWSAICNQAIRGKDSKQEKTGVRKYSSDIR